MRLVKSQDLSLSAFNKYGQFARIIDPQGAAIGPKEYSLFYDRLVFSYASSFPVSISVTRILRRPYIVDTTEIHRNSGEVLLPLTGDVYCHVGLPSAGEDPDYDSFDVFYIPKGTAVMLHNGVWHHAPFPCSELSVDILVLLPERTYALDCVILNIPETKQIEIVP